MKDEHKKTKGRNNKYKETKTQNEEKQVRALSY